MRVIHIVHGKCNPNGHNGISRVVYSMNKYEKQQGIRSEIWAVVDDAKEKYEKVRDEFVTVECYPRVRMPLGRHAIIEDLKKERDTIDLVHFHMIWFYDKNIIAKAVKELNIPYIITTHGTYCTPHAYTGKRRIARKLYELKYLQGADAIHIITREEGTGLARYGYKGPVFLGYNGIEKTEIPPERNNRYFDSKPYRDRIKLGWVGVLRADKNILSLVEAVRLIPEEIREQTEIILVGPDYKGNIRKYMDRATELGVRENFDWIGPLYGQEKYDAISSFDAFVMPSYSEVLSLAALDAMGCRVPCIVSSGCGYNYLIREYRFGLITEPYPSDIAETIMDFLQRRNEWEHMGDEGYRCVEKELNRERITEKMIQGYRDVISKAGKGRKECGAQDRQKPFQKSARH